MPRDKSRLTRRICVPPAARHNMYNNRQKIALHILVV
nr:MAG TPA: hypothetical protein [Caudoviricetes sp.]